MRDPFFLVKVFWVRVTEARTSKKEKIWRRRKRGGQRIVYKADCYDDPYEEEGGGCGGDEGEVMVGKK